jgi:uncharacterized membrane protein
VLIVVLVLSLMGNALALGALYRLREARSAFMGPEAAAARLPDDLRRDLRRALRAEGRELLPLLRQMGSARAAIIATLSADPFDRAAADAAMTRYRTALDALLDRAQVVVLDRMETRSND